MKERSHLKLVRCICLAAFYACGGGGSTSAGDVWTATIDTVGDTITVRTVSGSVWGDTAELIPEVSIGVLDGPDEYMLGSARSLAVSPDGEIYIMDSQVPALRKYDASGSYLRDLGREGGGPGEYKQADGGLAVLPDGRVVLRDPGNARFSVYGPEGDFLDTWRLPSGGGFNTGRKLYTDYDGSSYTMVLLEFGVPVTEWTYGLARFSSDGVHTDTVTAPVWDFERPLVSGQRENSSSSTGVPFNGTAHWAFSPEGYMVGGVATEYRVDLYRVGQPVLRIEKDWTPVAVLPDEAEENERRITHNFRNNFPGWRWNGPPIPDTKPPFNNLLVSDEGRVWVAVSQPAYPTMTAQEAREEEERVDRPVTRFSEPMAFDVFDAEGRFLGHVRTPRGFSLNPAPVLRGDYVWAVTRDELDVVTVARFRLQLPTET